MSDENKTVSIVVPAYKESGNIKALTERVFKAVREAGLEAEMIVVDDNSRDGTLEVVDSLKEQYPIRLIVREDEKGLSSAVLRGYEEARYDRLLVMDADLQHPPEAIPEMVEALDRPGCDFAIGTRYVKGGEIDKDWPWHRRMISLGARLMARPLTPLSDPLSGFFAIHRKTWEQASDINPIGYKIALEVYVKGKCSQPGEVTIRFAARHAGESKLTGAVVGHYVSHLFALYKYRFPWMMWLIVAHVVGLLGTYALFAWS